MTKYLYTLDYLRGFAALAVCLFHFTDKADYLAKSNLWKVTFSHGHLGVEIFFILSGLVIPYAMYQSSYTLDKAWTFLLKRIVRIEPPYLICVLLALFLNYLTTKSPVYVGDPFKIDPGQVFYHIGYLNSFMEKDWLNPVFWTLAIEFQYYLLIALIFPLISSRRMLIWVSTMVLFNVLSYYSSRNHVFHFSIFFTAGILLYRYLTHQLSPRMTIISVVAVLAFLILRYSSLEMIIVLGTSTIILLPLPYNKFAAFFGNISFSIYLLHFPIGLRLINLTQRFTDTEAFRELMVLVALLLSILVAYLYYQCIEKPCKIASQKIKYKKSNRQELRLTVPSPLEEGRN